MNVNTTIGQIEKLKKELDALRPLNPEAEEKLWKKLRLEWNYNSNHMEGNTLTYGETELLLLFGRTTGDHTKREYDEMQAHDVAIKMVRELAEDSERPLTEAFIRKLNEVILVKPYWKEAITPDRQATRREIKIGVYKCFPNSVRLKNGEIFNYATPEETPAQMHDLMKWYKENHDLHCAELAALFHYKLVRIHPFDDGNGRVARLIMNYILMKGGYVAVVIKSSAKDKYITALNRADVGELNVFVDYIIGQLPWSFNMAIKAAKGEDIEEQGDVDKQIELLSREVLVDGRINKSPKVVYEAFTQIKDEFWGPLQNAFKSFGEFFNENKITHYVNAVEEKYEVRRKNILEHPFIREESTKPVELKVFGYEIYEWEISQIRWSQTWYGLKGKGKQKNVDVNLYANFLDDDYSFSLFIDGKAAIEIKKSYKQLFDKKEIDDSIQAAKKLFLAVIEGNREGKK